MTFPIEYPKSTCNMKIRISYFHRYPGDEIWGRPVYSEVPDCFELNTKVNCEEEKTAAMIHGHGMKARTSSGSLKHNVDSSSTSMVAIICATVLVVTVVVAITVIATVVLIVKKKQIVEQERTREDEERNDRYRTYDQGIEYNAANDANPRYNEDGGNDDAIVTDENIFYHNPRDNQNGGHIYTTSPNGNVYYHL